MQPDINITILSNIHTLALEVYKSNESIQQSTEMSVLQCRVAEIWQQILGFDDLDLDDDLFKIGGDSIAAIQIFSAINDEFGVTIHTEELFSSEVFSIRWLADLIEKNHISFLGEDEYSKLLDQIEGLSEEEVAKLLLE